MRIPIAILRVGDILEHGDVIASITHNDYGYGVILGGRNYTIPFAPHETLVVDSSVKERLLTQIAAEL